MPDVSGPGAATAPAKDPAVEKLKAILNLPLGFKSYVFHGDNFPDCDFAKPDEAKKLLGEYTLRVTLYDRNFEKAKATGLIGAIVEVVPKEGTPMQRHFTLFRTAEKFDPAWRFQARQVRRTGQGPRPRRGEGRAAGGRHRRDAERPARGRIRQ